MHLRCEKLKFFCCLFNIRIQIKLICRVFIWIKHVNFLNNRFYVKLSFILFFKFIQYVYLSFMLEFYRVLFDFLLSCICIRWIFLSFIDICLFWLMVIEFNFMAFYKLCCFSSGGATIEIASILSLVTSSERFSMGTCNGWADIVTETGHMHGTNCNCCIFIDGKLPV